MAQNDQEIEMPAPNQSDEVGSDFVCIECGEELGSDDTCENPECPLFGASDEQQA